jgi:RHS repeat-associated protein
MKYPSPTASRADLTLATDYYPFGSAMPGRSFSAGEYRFGFNGKEKDSEGMGGGGSTYDYGFRIYNATLAKFLSVDPLHVSFPWYTPYQFAGNTPIMAIDLDGLEELIVVRYFEDGKYTGETAIRVPTAQRETSKQNGGDSQIIEMNSSQQGDFEESLRNRKSQAIASLKNSDGQFQGKYRDQMSDLDVIKNNQVITVENDPNHPDYKKYTPLPKELIFDFDDTNPEIISKEEIEKFKSWLELDEDRKVTIEAYSSEEYLTEEQGVLYNQTLSEKRAEEVKKNLISNGIDPSRIISSEGKGVSTDSNVLEENRKAILKFTYTPENNTNETH